MWKLRFNLTCNFVVSDKEIPASRLVKNLQNSVYVVVDAGGFVVLANVITLDVFNIRLFLAAALIARF